MSVRFDPDALYVALDRKRRTRRISWRGLCREAGCAPSTTTRLAHDQLPDVHNLARLLTWLGDTDLGPYITDDGQTVEATTRADAWHVGER